MTQAKLIHNPRCSKSRQALAILEENNIQFEIVEYLKNPLSVKELQDLIKRTGKEPIDLVRTKESLFKELGLAGRKLDAKQWAEIIEKNPILLERPIFDNGKQAVVGRPPEDILTIIKP